MHSTTNLIISSRFCVSRFSFRGACFPDGRGKPKISGNLLPVYVLSNYEFLFSSGLDLRYNDSVALLRLVFRAIFHPGLPAFTVLPDSSFFSSLLNLSLHLSSPSFLFILLAELEDKFKSALATRKTKRVI